MERKRFNNYRRVVLTITEIVKRFSAISDLGELTIWVARGGLEDSAADMYDRAELKDSKARYVKVSRLTLSTVLSR
jgi:hypothetical protein